MLSHHSIFGSKEKFTTFCVSLLVTLSLCTAAPSAARRNAIQKVLFQGPQVFITVSPEDGTKKEGDHTILLDRMLVLHWRNFQNQPNDAISLFSENPATLESSNIQANLLESHIVTTSSGDVKSTVRYERRPLDPTSERCVGFWVAYMQNGTAIKSQCLEIHPTWMNDLESEIQNIPITSLMIPGTHNAGAWHYYEGGEGIISEYTYCHEDSIYEQLVNGIRSLDVRVGYYPLTADKFYSNHDAVRIRPLKLLLEDVRRFVSETNEIVFLDFHRFPTGFNSADIHHKLVAFIQTYLGDYLASKSLTPLVTPRQLWDLQRPVIALYAEGSIASEFDILWNGVDQAWGDTNKIDELESFLGNAIQEKGCRGNVWSLMSQLTPTPEDILLRPRFGLRGFANVSNIPISDWFMRENWYSKSMIVALDYYQATNLVETAIEVNKNLGNVCV